MFRFRLAALLGKTVRQLESELDSREFAEWMAFDRLSRSITHDGPKSRPASSP